MSHANFGLIFRRWLPQCWRVYVGFAGLALVVLGPLLRPGYVLTMDLVFTPKLRMPDGVSSSYLLHVLLRGLNFVLPGDVIEKILLFVILWLAGVGLYQLARYLMSQRADIYMRLGCYAGGILYMINPFTYDRFMAGQYNVVFGYALLPWFVRALLRFLSRPGWRLAVVLTLWAVAISIISIHAVGFMALLAVIGGALQVWRSRKDRQTLRTLLKYGVAAVLGFVLLSSYWLVPLAQGHGATANEISNFTSTDQAAFATLGSGVLGRLGNVLRLQGFWVEGQGLYNLPQTHAPLWGVLTLLVWALVVAGLVSMWRGRQRLVVVTFGLPAAVASLLAAGVYNDWLAAHVPFFAGYREPQKFVAVVALAYGVFAARGTAETLRYLQREGNTAICALMGAVILLLPLAWTPTMLWGFDRQLSAAQYPQSWAVVNNELDAAPGSFKVLFLPWHLYMYFGFAGRLIANPAPQYFNRPIVSSNDPEFRNIKAVPSALDNSVAAALNGASRSGNLGRQLAADNIRYIVVAREGDYANYGYLNHRADFRLIYSSPSIEVFRNQAYRGPHG